MVIHGRIFDLLLSSPCVPSLRPPASMTHLRRNRFILSVFLAAFTSAWQPALAADKNWTAGSGTNFNWSDAANWSAGLPGLADDLFFNMPVPNPGTLANPNFINLSAGSLANRLTVRDNYTLNGGSLTLGAGGLYVNLGQTLTLNSLLTGTEGLLKTGGGAVWLTNAANTYTGTTTISNGSLIISHPGALGASTSPVVITGSGTRGFAGGQLVLVGGYLSGFEFTRDLALAGFGPIGDRSASVISIGDNELSGAITTAALQNTRLTSVGGLLTISGSLDVAGVAGTNVTGLGGAANTNGTGTYLLSGVLTGTGTLEKTGSGTLILNPSDTSGFSGVIRVGASTATMTSSVRIISENVLGTRTAGGTGSVLDLNTGTLEIRMDAPSLLAGGSAANVYQRNNATIFADHSMTGTAVNGTATFGALAFEDNFTLTLNSRNGYGMTFGVASVAGTIDANSTIANNLGGDLTFNGNFWNNNNTTAARTMTISGNGNTVINGSIIADAGASFDHVLTKSGTGLLKVTGVASTLDGAVNVQGGTLMITDFRSVTNNANVINLGNSTTTAGALYIGTSVTPTAAGLTTNKVINLFGTTGGATVYASQPGALPVVLNSNFTVTGVGAKILTLGGSNSADNIINGIIPNHNSGNLTSLSKAGPGTWVLAGANTYTGTTLIYNGTLKLKANAATSTVLTAANAVTFNANNVYAGGTLELVGQAGVNNVQNLGALTVTQGANTLRLTPGASGGNASLVFSSLASAAGTAGLNIISPNSTSTVTFTGLATGFAGSSVYYNGSNFGYSAAGVIRAPVYGTDAGFATSTTALTASAHNEVMGNITTAGMTILSLKLDGSRNLTLNSAQTLIVQASGANSIGGILATGGESTISGGTAIHTGGSGALVVRVNELTDKLTISTLISSGTTGGLTKNGAGTLVLTAANTNTGVTTINEGTIQLSGVGRVGNAVSTTIRQAGTLDLNGVSTTIASWNNNGLLTNTSTSAATLTIGSGNGTGTSFGSFQQTSGIINVVKTGTGAMNWYGVSNYTGSTTIGSTGLITVDVLADIGVASSIGAGSLANNAGSLIFNGSTGGIVYAGSVRDYELIYGATSASTDRLFTLAGSGATFSSTAANNNSIIWSNTGDIVHSVIGSQLLTLTGTSTGDNRMNPRITDSGTATNITSVTKTGTGFWILGNSNNSYSGATTISNGTLGLASMSSLPAASNLVFNGGTLQASGLLNRELGTGANQFRFATPAANTARFSGYSAGAEKLIVSWTSTPVWGSTSNFLDNRNGLIFGAMQGTTAVGLSEVELKGNFSLGTAVNSAKSVVVTTTSGSATVTLTTGDTSGMVIGQTITGSNIPVGSYIVAINSATGITISANASASATGTPADVEALPMRTIRVDANGSTSTSFATITGNISGNAGTGLRKTGGGLLQLFGNNSYSGETNINQGTLVVQSLGNSNVAGNSSVGTNTNANLLSNAVTIGNGGTGGAILQYVGAGEVSNRMILLNSTTGNPQIHADGSGPLVLTNVVNNTAGENKTLFLRGTNTAGNMITSNLVDSGGTLGLTVDGSATWILTGNNTFTGTTTASAGSLGIGSDGALSATSFITITNGSMFAYGGDRTINRELRHANNTSAAFFGDHNLTFTNYAIQADANNATTVNSIAAGKALILNSVTADKITAARTWTVNGPGDTVVNGNVTTSTGFNLNISYSGTGSLTLGGSNNQLNAGVITVSSGTLKIGANNALNSATTSNLVINPVAGVTATLDVNGQTDTVRGITATTVGTTYINNSAATAASLSFGNGDQAVNFIGSVINTGAGALSLTKIGTGVASFTGGTYAHKGATVVTGGSLTLAGNVSNTSSLSVTGTGSLLALTGGFSGSTGLTGLTVGAGATLSLLDGQGTLISNLTSLSLGVGGSGTATLNVNVGTGNTDTITLLSGGSLTLGNTITFNMNDAGLEPNSTYTLLNVPSGLTSLGVNNFIRGTTPGGFSSITWTVTDTHVQISTGTLVTGSLYWRGLTNTTWNGNINNWSDQAGTTPSVTIPGAGTDVVFQANAAPGGTLTTTLEQNFKINSLSFQPSTNTPTSVTINSGAVATNRLDISPQNSSQGITLAAGGPASVIINTAFRLGADQTWNTASGTVLTLNGALQGPGSITKTGVGRASITAAADPAYGGTTVNINGGVLDIGNVTALGSTAAGNLSAININTGGTFLFNGAASTTTNPLTLNGGTLSAGGGTQTYSGAISIPTNSFINMLDPVTVTPTGRSITISGVLSGTGRLTIDGINTVSGGNQVTGTLTLSNNNSGWSGGLNLLRGTVTASNVNGLGTGEIRGSGFGRVIFGSAGGTTMNLSQNITLDAPGGVLELSAVPSGTPTADMVANLNGVITIGSAANANNALRFSQSSNNFGVINITNSIVLGNNASISYQGTSGRFLDVSAVISDGGSGYNLSLNDELYGWAVTSQTIRLSGANTFSGALLLNEGTVEFSTVNNVGGGPSNLGQGSAITLTGGTLRFIGGVSQTTNRPISVANTVTLGANGTDDAVVTYTGGITQVLNSQLILTGSSTGEGVIAGNVTQLGVASDITVNSGNWTFTGSGYSLADDIIINNANTKLKLGMATLNTNGGANTDASIFVRGGAELILDVNDALGIGYRRIALADGTLLGTGTLSMNGKTVNIKRVDVGAIADGYTGYVTGIGTINLLAGATDLSDGLRVFRGTVSADIAGVGTLLKQGLGDVTLSGSAVAWTGNAASRLDSGNLILDFSTNNEAKIPSNVALDMRGGTLTLDGGITANSEQAVASYTLASGGANTITMLSGDFTTTLNLGVITRAVATVGNASAGTLRINLGDKGFVKTTTVNSTTTGLLGTSAYATVTDATGTWFARNDGSGNIVALTSTVKNNAATWVAGDHVTDGASAFTGTVNAVAVNSVRFDAATGAAVNISPTGSLSLSSGGVLVTDQVINGSVGFLGGNLTSTTGEIILTHDSSQLFTLSSDIRLTNMLTKTGNGALLLSGNNTYTGSTNIMGGLVQLSGGNAIGDTSNVTLSDDRIATLELLNSETIGRLNGGSATSGLNTLAKVLIGSNTLTLNTVGGSAAYAGLLIGNGTIIKQGTGNQNITNNNDQFVGNLIINEGLFQLSGIGQINASSITINKGGNLLLDNNGTTRLGTRILDTTPLFLNSADGVFSGETIVRGLAFRTDQDSGTANTETIGVLTLSSGANYATLQQSGGNSSRAVIIAQNLVRENSATLDVRGRALGSNSTTGGQSTLRVADANQTAFIATMTGGGGALGTPTVSIVPWAIGENTSVALTASHMGNSLVTYVATRGFIALDFATEYATYATAGATSNTREVLASNPASVAGKTINSLVLHNNAIAAAAYSFTGTGTGGQTLTINSGALLFTLNPAAVAGAYGLTLSGFDGGIKVGPTNEYVFHVVNPDNSKAAALTATVSSPLNSTADITKSGRGVLVLTGTNSAGGGTRKTTINEGTLEIADLDNIGGNTGSLVFAGGTLRLATGFTDDFSSRIISFLQGGATIDTNGANITLANSIGSGAGGLTKIGAGILTLNAAATYTGATIISGGTVAIGANNAIGNGNLTLNAGTILALGTYEINVGLVTTAGASPNITGAGSIFSTGGFVLNHTGDTTINAVLSSSSGLTKTQTNTVTLTGANTYTGITEVQNGGLSFNSIGNVGSGPSALGNPSNAQIGVIRMGNSTSATTLTYTGAVGSTDRVIAMTGTTGGLTLNANGTGGIQYGGVKGFTEGAKTLTLGGTAVATLINNPGRIEEGASTLSLTKSGVSTWALTSANTYSGVTSITAGILRISDNSALGSATNGTTLSGDTSTGVLELTNNITVTGELLTLGGRQGAGINNTHLRNLSGNNEWAGNINFTSVGNTYNIESAAGNLTISGQISGSVALDGRILQFTGAGNGHVSGPIINGPTANILVNKLGSGVWTFSGENTYGNNTSIQAGTLLINNLTGSGTGTGTVAVSASGTLGGFGKITGAVTVSSGATLSPGGHDISGISTAGQLTVGTLTANTGSTLFLQIGGATLTDTAAMLAYQANPTGFTVPSTWTDTYTAGSTQHDQVLITGTGVQTVGGIVQISPNYLNGFSPSFGQVFHFVDWASLGTSSLGGTPSFNLPSLPGAMNWDTSFFNSHGLIIVVPEPSRILLLILGSLAFFIRRRR